MAATISQSVLPPPGRSLPLLREWKEFADLLSSTAIAEARFLHADELKVEQVPTGQVRGVNIFGPGHDSFIIDAPNGACITRRIESLILNNATLMLNSMTILDSNLHLVPSTMDNIPHPNHIASYDWNYQVGTDGTLSLSSAFFESRAEADLIAMPVCGPGLPNYGHFLYDGLPSVFMLHRMLGGDIRIVGQPLTSWQAQILHSLGLLSSYVAIERPTRFRKLLCTTMASLHLRYPSRFARVVFDFIRFRVGASSQNTGTRVFLSRGASTKRSLNNRAEVEETVRRMGFEVICPDRMTFEEQVRRMASARVVVGEAGAGFANIGFCDSGAIVLEILPFSDPWTRGACFQLGHRWHGFFPLVGTAPDDGRPDWERLTYTVDCHELTAVIETITRSREI